MEAASTRDQLPEDRAASHHAVSPSRHRVRAGAIAELLAVALPLVGLVSLLLRSQLDPHLENYRLHFVLFGLVGTIAFVLGFAAGEAANRRGDARVLLLSLAFMATGGFMGLHALGTPGVLFTGDHSGFKVAIPVGLLVSAGFAAASAFVDLRPGFAPLAIRHRRMLRASVLLAMTGWFVWTIANLPPLDGPNSEAARGPCSQSSQSWARSSTRPAPRATGRSSARGRTCSRPR
jgi:adenylate cyclase